MEAILSYLEIAAPYMIVIGFAMYFANTRLTIKRTEKPYEKKCENCYYWRDKGWGDESSGVGVCDNLVFNKKVRCSVGILLSNPEVKKQHRILTDNDFCCNNYSKDIE
jgi:hypothetical protein